MYHGIINTLLLPIRMSVIPIWGAIAGGLASGIAGGLLGGGQSPTTTMKPMYTGISGGGLFDTSKVGKGLNISLTPEMQAVQQGLFGAAGGMTPYQQQAAQLGQGFLGQVGAFDPWSAAQTQFSRIEDILAPMRERERQAQESRLFAQGRLGSTGGGLEQQAFQSAIEQQRAQSLMEALGQAQDIQGNLINRGAFLSNIPQQQQTQALQNLLGIQQGAMGQLGQQIGGAYAQTQQPSFGSQIGTGLMMGGAGMLSKGIGGLFSGGGTATPAATNPTGGSLGLNTGAFNTYGR